ncbi:hypothetical protein ES288_D11G288200v1 [Gossypium darwinii]|uniref:UDP-3-O-acyl-N-acetylglucosamine deacetylase n=1 Tax=Gossypium darwinii TaxID=34276 RepID=A0A5D2APL5_GOSDA|nr:hypothetical protein ES288_D11G288200v1 [Gossypium darwinii]
MATISAFSTPLHLISQIHFKSPKNLFFYPNSIHFQTKVSTFSSNNLTLSFKNSKTLHGTWKLKSAEEEETTVVEQEREEKAGKTPQSGKVSKVKIWPGFTGQGRYFEFHSNLIPASIDFVRESLLCTSLCKDGYKIRTVEHLLSALEAKGIDNCRIQIQSLDSEDTEVEVPIFDGSANAWVEAIEQVGRKEALDRSGNNVEKLAPYLSEPFYVSRNDSFMVAFPASKVHISCGIDFPKGK